MTGFKATTLSTTTLIKAYETAGVEPPKTLRPSPTLAAIRDLPSVEAVEREIVAALQDVNVKDPNKVARDLASKHADAVAADQLRQGLGKLTSIASDRKSTRLNSSHVKISYAVFCLKKKTTRCRCSIRP